jgi:hypothetical protein
LHNSYKETLKEIFSVDTGSSGQGNHDMLLSEQKSVEPSLEFTGTLFELDSKAWTE